MADGGLLRVSRPRWHYFALLFLLAALGGGAILGFGAATPASAASQSPPGCTDGYVVGSAPLKNDTTNEAEWSWGYVQLWYANSCQENWARVVSLLNGTYSEYVEVDRSDGQYKWNGIRGSTPIETPGIYSPSLKDAAYALVYAGAYSYTAYWPQPGF